MNTVDTYKVEITNPGDISAGSGGGDASAANQVTGNTSLASIDTKLSSQATAAKQDTGNTSVANVDTNLGAKADSSATTDSGTFSLISLTKRLLSKIPALGAATAANSLPVTLSTDGQFVTSTGSVTETAPATDTASSGLNGRLQRIAQRITSLIALLPTALGQTTKSASLAVTIASDDDLQGKLGSLTETAPASDTASSGVNGRLQRIAQRLTSLIALLPSALGQTTKTGSLSVTIASDDGIQGRGASGSALSGNPVLIGGSDGTNARSIATETNGQQRMTLYNAAGTVISATQTGGVDGNGTSTGIQVHTYQYLFNGTSFDRVRNVSALSILASAARTTSQNSADQTNYNFRGLFLTVDVSNAGTGSITPSIQVKDSISGNYKTIWTAATPITTNGTYVYALTPGIAAASFTEAVAIALGRTWRAAITANNANSITYSVSADMLPL